MWRRVLWQMDYSPAGFSEVSVNLYQCIRRNISEDSRPDGQNVIHLY
jgi:hypothetical protein